jgi:replication initiation protein RepC
MLGTISNAERYRPAEAINPNKALAAFKAAAPFLGLRPTIVHAVDWLFRFTNPIDWDTPSRPIVWPSAAMQQQEMGLGPSQVKNLNRSLVELGLISMRDSPNGKRYGRRGPGGRIVEAYGFDLSPIASRFEEFQAIAKAGREERDRIQALRRRATIARNGVRQIIETAREQKIDGDEWRIQAEAAAGASRGIAGHGRADEMEFAVAKLERLQTELRDRLEALLSTHGSAESSSSSDALPVDIRVDTGPSRPTNWPHITITSDPFEKKDTVIAHEECSSPRPPTRAISPDAHAASDSAAVRGAATSKSAEGFSRRPHSSAFSLTPTELISLAPRLTTYLRGSLPSWPEIIDAADWLREEMGISKSVWGDACISMGRECAAVTVAIVSSKPPNHFRGSPGAYFYGMVSRAKAGELNLSRTIWGLRGATQAQRTHAR